MGCGSPAIALIHFEINSIRPLPGSETFNIVFSDDLGVALVATGLVDDR
jgi:hypothetical protein